MKKVTGDARPEARGTPQAIPLKDSEVSISPSNKIMLGDWPWHANRLATAKRTAWHGYGGKRYLNMLFGDGHSENFKFPKEMNDSWISIAPDPTFKWW